MIRPKLCLFCKQPLYKQMFHQVVYDYCLCGSKLDPEGKISKLWSFRYGQLGALYINFGINTVSFKPHKSSAARINFIPDWDLDQMTAREVLNQFEKLHLLA